MEKHWLLETNGAPLVTLHKFITDLWQIADIDYLYSPLKIEEPPFMEPRLIANLAQLADINPFTPLMTSNIARDIPGLVKEHPGTRIGVIMRPCEVKSLGEMEKSGNLDLSNIVIISVDCLGTFPADEYEWRAKRKGSPEELSGEAIQFTRQGGIVPYRFRSACQACETPMAIDADLNIGVIGLPIRKSMIVMTRNGFGEAGILDEITNGIADKALVAQREEIGEKIVHRRISSRERITEALSESIPADIDSLIDQFEECGTCTDCLDACPLCEIHYPVKDADGRYLKDDIMRWVISCSGCGICDQVCPSHKPLTITFAKMKEIIQDIDLTI